MPIKLNGTTIFNENNFADKNLSNLTTEGSDVISSIANSTMASGNYMKKINTKAGVQSVSTGSAKASITTTSDGWILLLNATNSASNFTIDSLNVYVPSSSSISMPVCNNVQIESQMGSNSFTIVFYPEFS